MQPFAPGQVWTYHTRLGEDASRVVICLVKADPKAGEIVHIQVTGLKLKSKHAPGGMMEQISHMPYAGDVLRQDIIKLETTAQPPDIKQHIDEWQAAFDQGKGGVWKLPVAEIIAGMEQGLSQ